MVGRPIYQAVDVRQGVKIIRASAVEVSVIDTHSPVTVRLGDHDDVGLPSRVPGFAYEPG